MNDMLHFHFDFIRCPPQFQPIVSLSTLNSPVRFKIDLNHLNFTNPIPTNFSSTDWNVQSQTVLNQYIERNSIQSDAQSQSKALHSLKTKNGERINGSTNVEHVGEKNLVLPYETGQIKFYSNSNEWQCGEFGHSRAPNSEMNTNRIELNWIELNWIELNRTEPSWWQSRGKSEPEVGGGEGEKGVQKLAWALNSDVKFTSSNRATTEHRLHSPSANLGKKYHGKVNRMRGSVTSAAARNESNEKFSKIWRWNSHD